MDLSFLRPAAAAAPNPAGRPAHCPVDHYLQPGLLHINDDDPSETRWVPIGNVDATAGLTYADVDDRDDGPLGGKGGETLFTDLATGQLDGLEWARDKVILLVGASARSAVPAQARGPFQPDAIEPWTDRQGPASSSPGSSHDRNNLQQLAKILEVDYNNWGGHRGGYLRVPSLNLTLLNYFLCARARSLLPAGLADAGADTLCAPRPAATGTA